MRSESWSLGGFGWSSRAEFIYEWIKLEFVRMLKRAPERVAYCCWALSRGGSLAKANNEMFSLRKSLIFPIEALEILERPSRICARS